jgi:magnesium chelatase subunit I
LSDEATESAYLSALNAIEPLKALIQKYQPRVAPIDMPFLMEFVLWALVEFKQLSKRRTADGLSINDIYDQMIKGL